MSSRLSRNTTCLCYFRKQTKRTSVTAHAGRTSHHKLLNRARVAAFASRAASARRSAPPGRFRASLAWSCGCERGLSTSSSPPLAAAERRGRDRFARGGGGDTSPRAGAGAGAACPSAAGASGGRSPPCRHSSCKGMPSSSRSHRSPWNGHTPPGGTATRHKLPSRRGAPQSAYRAAPHCS